ncbi:hypothetical protein TWF703_002683 [Orbilia oligospora]|uniref:UBC core domain-containing protein n=1 Tax=Orbilia oligospora TaxID=2813651 RepID=A0A7C8JLG7_ORBOL|nr:hypothetical protein TWF703_002683 [Orbilia oligospora]
MFAQKRLGKELSNIHKSLPPGISIASASDFSNWKMDIQVLDTNPLYADQIYRLNFKFSGSYPIEAPEVTFIKEDGRDIPMHPHSKINTNPEDAIQVSNTERPPGDETFVRSGYRSPRNINFVYDDNTV